VARPQPNPDVLTRAETAVYLRISDSKLIELLAAGAGSSSAPPGRLDGRRALDRPGGNNRSVTVHPSSKGISDDLLGATDHDIVGHPRVPLGPCPTGLLANCQPAAEGLVALSTCRGSVVTTGPHRRLTPSHL
jgi:hypothetical protein